MLIETNNTNIWKYHANSQWIVIPTNLSVNSTGHAVMGRGLAKELKERHPLIPELLGKHLKETSARILFLPLHKVICFPTKDRYDEDSKVTLIARCAAQLQHECSKWNSRVKVYLPQLGCGPGNLSWEREVKPVLDAWLDDRFVALVKENYNG